MRVCHFSALSDHHVTDLRPLGLADACHSSPCHPLRNISVEAHSNAGANARLMGAAGSRVYPIPG